MVSEWSVGGCSLEGPPRGSPLGSPRGTPRGSPRGSPRGTPRGTPRGHPRGCDSLLLAGMIDRQRRPSAVVLVLALREAFRGSPDSFLSESGQGSLIILTMSLSNGGASGPSSVEQYKRKACASGGCPEALRRSSKPRLRRLCACTAPPRRAQKLPHWKDFVLLLLRREVPKSAQTHSAHDAHRSSPQCSLEKTTAPAVLI